MSRFCKACGHESNGKERCKPCYIRHVRGAPKHVALRKLAETKKMLEG